MHEDTPTARRYEGMPAGSPTQTTNITRNTRGIVVSFTADPDGLKENLPPGLTLHPSNTVRMSMYRVTEPFDSTHFEPYSVTYLAIEVEDHDTEMVSANDGADEYPGRFFARYWTDSLDQVFLKRETRGIPARLGTTEWETQSEQLDSTLYINDEPIIQVSVDVQEEVTDQIRGHLNYYARRQIPAPEGPICEIDELIELPIPLLLDVLEADTDSASMEFSNLDHATCELESLRPNSIEDVIYCDFAIPHYPTGYVVKDYLTDDEGIIS